MNDLQDRRDPRRFEAMQTNQSGGRGWNFCAVPEEPSFLQTVFVALFRPSTLFAGLLLGLSIFLIVRF